MNISVRKATINDAQIISDIILDSLGFYNPVETIHSGLENICNLDTDIVLIAECDGEAVGFIHAENYTPLYSPPLKDIMSLAVKKEYQAHKIGTRLINEVEKWALETGRQGVQVLSQLAFTGAHKFYESMGYTVNKQQINFIKYF